MLYATEFVSITPSQSGATLTFQLKLWPDGADVGSDTPIEDKAYTAYIKGSVEGLTVDQLINRGLKEVGDSIQTSIIRWNKFLSRTDSIDWAAKNTLLEAGLNGDAN